MRAYRLLDFYIVSESLALAFTIGVGQAGVGQPRQPSCACAFNETFSTGSRSLQRLYLDFFFLNLVFLDKRTLSEKPLIIMAGEPDLIIGIDVGMSCKSYNNNPFPSRQDMNAQSVHPKVPGLRTSTNPVALILSKSSKIGRAGSKRTKSQLG